MDDIILVDKPAGITSFGVIRELRKRLGVRKIGHAGTLDPLATGLMILGVGAGTKKLTTLVKLDKEYLAEIRVGEKRSTGDLEGDIIAVKPVTYFSEVIAQQTLNGMVGTLTLPVSAYSAIKKDGVPMYKRARQAEKTGDTVIDVPVRAMQVYAAELLGCQVEHDRAVVTVRFAVGSGTYIRSLAEEFGERLGYPATLQLLRRTKVGEYDIADAKQIEDF
jgi:tRNA pseudouridine55 synthase